MFNRYWRDFPWLTQLLLFTALVLMLSLFALYVMAPWASVWLTGIRSVDPATLSKESPAVEIRASLIWQGVFHLGMFLLPAAMYAWHAAPSPRSYLGLRRPGRRIHWLLVCGVIIGAMPLMLQLQVWMRMIPFGPEVVAAQEAHERLTEAFLLMPSLNDFMIVFLVMAILPAVGEELFFRGVLMRFAARRNADSREIPDPQVRSMWFPVIISAGLFTLVHSSVYGLPSIFIAGMLLSLVYYLTGSLWCSILAHFLNNGIQVVIVYLAGTGQTAEIAEIPVWALIAGLALFIVSFTLLWQKRTMLPLSWASGSEDSNDVSPVQN